MVGRETETQRETGRRGRREKETETRETGWGEERKRETERRRGAGRAGEEREERKEESKIPKARKDLYVKKAPALRSHLG